MSIGDRNNLLSFVRWTGNSVADRPARLDFDFDSYWIEKSLAKIGPLFESDVSFLSTLAISHFYLIKIRI